MREWGKNASPKECETKEKPDASTHQSRFVFLVSKVRFSCLFCINKNKINYYVMNNINYNNTSSNRRRSLVHFVAFIFVVRCTRHILFYLFLYVKVENGTDEIFIRKLRIFCYWSCYCMSFYNKWSNQTQFWLKNNELNYGKLIGRDDL